MQGMVSSKDGAEIREGGRGGILVYDLDGDGLLDYLVTRPGRLAAYGHDGKLMWSRDAAIRLSAQSENEGLPGLHAPGAVVGDPDGDGSADVLFLEDGGDLVVADARTGSDKTRKNLRPPWDNVPAWEHLVLANLRGGGDKDLVVQATNRDGYRMGRYIAAYALDASDGAPLWSSDRFLACAHNGLRAFDLDQDGRDEVVGGTIFRPDGTLVSWTERKEGLYALAKKALMTPLNRREVPLFDFPHFEGHLDSVFVDDVVPDKPGLEVVALQEGGAYRTFLYSLDGLIWQNELNYEEPQNAALGEFDTDRPGLEVWCRSRHKTDQTPWVFSANGEVIAAWQMKEKAPADWTRSGIEEIYAIHWDGGPKQYLAAKERHEKGDVAVINATTGDFIKRFPDQAHRLHVADVSGDWREELIVVSEDEVRIYWNPAPNPRPDGKRLWETPQYRRSKMTYNYYSP